MRTMRILAAALLVVVQAPAVQDASKVVFVSAKQIHADILKAPDPKLGVAVIDLLKTPEYLASVIRRTKPGTAEVHKKLTDIWYVIEGGGTLVTDGSLAEPAEATPGEFRGRSVLGGESRHIAEGDIVRIPAGVPHWVQKIDSQRIIYLVVKVPSQE